MQDTIIDLIRHGEPVGGRRYRGQCSDDPLSERGWEQMWSVVGDRAPWHQIVSSPLARCRAFAAALATRRGLPLAVEPRFREVGLGTWEGLTPDQVKAREPWNFEAFYQDPARNRPPGAESLEELARRVGKAFEETVAGHPGRHLLVVAHAGVIRALIGHLLHAEAARWYRIRVDYAGVTRVRIDRYGARLEVHNSAQI
jgi:probable phosphoglycerate mutase